MSNLSSLVFYIFTFLIVVLLNFFFDIVYNNTKKKNVLLLLIMFILLTTISGYRYYVGSDYAAYINMYYHHSYLDFGSRILFDICNRLSSNPQTIIVIYSGLTNLFLILILSKIKKYVKSTWLIIATYLFIYMPFAFNIIRQSLSMVICLYAFLLLYENKRKASFSLLLIGIMIHTSAIVCLPYFVIYISTNKEQLSKKIIKLTLIILFSIFSLSYVFNNVLHITKYFGYMKYFSLKKIEVNLIISYIPFFIIITLFKRSIQKNINLLILKNIFLSGVFIEIIFSSSQIYRIGMYFSINLIILIPILIEQTKLKNTKFILKISYLLFLILYFTFIYYHVGRAEIFPYNNILF